MRVSGAMWKLINRNGRDTVPVRNGTNQQVNSNQEERAGYGEKLGVGFI